MKLRPAQPADATALADLWNGMILNTLATFTTIEKTAQDLRDMISSRPNAFWVAQEDGLAGFVTYGPFRAGPGYAATVEHTIILDPRAQGRGHGRALMAHAMTAAATAGHHIMVAGISSANPQAVAFHRALGCEQTGLMHEVGRKGGAWLDLILMQKTLTTS